MFGKHKTDVMVAGAGPVGLFTALLLAERDIDVTIVDEEWRTAGHAYGLALHPATLRLLDAEGLITDLLREAVRIEKIAFYDGADRHAELDVDVVGGPFPYLLALPQSALEAAFEERLKKKNVKVLWNHRLAGVEDDGGRVKAEVHELGKVSSGYAFAKTEWSIEKSRTYECAFVIGADGHRSLVRKNLDIDYDVVHQPDYFAVWEIATESPVMPELRLVMDRDTDNVLWPLPGGNCRWSFQLTDADLPESSRTKSRLSVQIGEQAYPFVTEERMRELIAARAPWFDAEVKEINWSLAIRFERKLAPAFGRGRVWLVGDAAHLTSPVGGQSMNVGLREARDLVDRIVDILRSGAPVDSLAEYDRGCHAEWSQLQGLGWRLAAAGDATDPWFLERGKRLLPALPASGDDLNKLAAGAGLTLISD